jgi:hypothetical protein
MVTDTAAERPGARREGLLARHPLVFFITYAVRRCLLTPPPCFGASAAQTPILAKIIPLPIATTKTLATSTATRRT